jgi:hypothetical protein
MILPDESCPRWIPLRRLPHGAVALRWTSSMRASLLASSASRCHEQVPGGRSSSCDRRSEADQTEPTAGAPGRVAGEVAQRSGEPKLGLTFEMWWLCAGPTGEEPWRRSWPEKELTSGWCGGLGDPSTRTMEWSASTDRPNLRPRHEIRVLLHHPCSLPVTLENHDPSMPCLYVYFQNNTVNSIVCNDITRFFSFLNGLPIPLDDLTCEDQKYLASSRLICLEFCNKHSFESCQNILCIVQ